MRLILMLLAAVIVAPCATANPGDDMVQACTRTAHAYAIHRDALDAKAYTDVFTADGVFATPGPKFTGREQLQAYVRSQPEDQRTLHHITTMHITPTGATTATGIVYVIVQFSKRAATGSAVLERIANAMYHDDYVLENGVCKIRYRELKIVMDTRLPDQ